MGWTAPKTNWVAPDRATMDDFNRIESNILWLYENHATSEAAGVHGATSAATANKIIQRDANGRAQVANPSAEGDIATKATVTAEAGARAEGDATLLELIEGDYLPLAGGALTGKVTAMPDPDDTAQIRNFKIMATIPTVDDLAEGEIAFVYSA